MIKMKIRDNARKAGITTAYQLQKACSISPNLAARLYRDEVELIALKTLETLCAAFKCSVCDLFGEDAAQTVSDEAITLSSNSIEDVTLSSNSVTDETSEDEKVVSVPIDVPADETVIDSETWLSTSEAAARLGIAARTVRDWIKRGKLPATQRETPQGYSNFIKEADLLEFQPNEKDK